MKRRLVREERERPAMSASREYKVDVKRARFLSWLFCVTTASSPERRLDTTPPTLITADAENLFIEDFGVDLTADP
mgnify:CR=1 FL=1